MITGTDFGDTQDDTVFSARDLRSSSGPTNLATPSSSRLEPSPFGNRPLGPNQPSQAVDSPALEEMEIPESPSTVRVSPAASVGRHHNNSDSSEVPTATAAVTQVIPPHTEVEDQPEGQEQGQEEPVSSGSDLPPSRQPDTPIPSSPIPALESGTILESQRAEAVQECRPRAQIASRAVSPARDFAHPEGGTCVNVGDVTFLHVEGHRETTSGPEYLFMGKMWLGADAGVPFNLLRAYRRDITRGDRLATLRIRKRTSEEVDMVKATRCSTRKKAKRA